MTTANQPASATRTVRLNPNGKYGVIKLQKGTIEVDLANIGKAVNNTAPIVYSTTTCSVALTATAPAMLLNGTGAYKGISGTLKLTETFALILPRVSSGKHKGQCNESNSAIPLATWGSVTGSGNVSYSSQSRAIRRPRCFRVPGSLRVWVLRRD